MAAGSDVPQLMVADQAAWRAWLEANHADSKGVWLRIAKKGTTEPTTLKISEALDEALCFGWIDGQRNTYDETTFNQRFTPRRPRSPWSARNVGYIERLTKAGRMRPAGVAEVERAKADGRWAVAYKGPATIEVPPDLAAALDANPDASAMFAVLTSQNRFSVIVRVDQAKRPETRQRRIDDFVAMLARGETIHPQKRTRSD